MPAINDYGQQVTYVVPKEIKDASGKKTVDGDLMRGNTTVSDTDVNMLLNAWKTGQPQFFDKDPDQAEATKQEWAQKAKDFVSKLFNR